jgi:hypothetical protein
VSWRCNCRRTSLNAGSSYPSLRRNLMARGCHDAGKAARWSGQPSFFYVAVNDEKQRVAIGGVNE